MEERKVVYIENTEQDMRDYFSLTESEVQLLRYLFEGGYLDTYTRVQFNVEMLTPMVFGSRTKGVR